MSEKLLQHNVKDQKSAVNKPQLHSVNEKQSAQNATKCKKKNNNQG